MLLIPRTVHAEEILTIMIRRIIALLITTQTIWVCTEGYNCTCTNPEWCKPITTPLPEKEIFTFVTENDDWKLYDWSKITTIATFAKPLDPQLVCYAHSLGVRVVLANSFGTLNLTNEIKRHEAVQHALEYMQMNNLDGINVDYEKPIRKNEGAKRDGLSLLVLELSTAIKKTNPHSQITFDTAHRPTSISRVYDYLSLSKAVDFFFIMDYDVSGRDHPWSNCPLNTIETGIQQFVQRGIPFSKLVLGVPWYGYNYPCKDIKGGVKCRLASGGTQVKYKDIVETYLPQAIGGRKFDNVSKSPFINYKGHSSKQLHQIWYEDPESLAYRYQYAVQNKMRGVGMWHADALDYGNSTSAQKMRKEMWGALPKYHAVRREKLSHNGIAAAACTCKNPDWCKSIATPLPEKEVFTFITSHTNWPLYDWDKITTIAAFMNPIDANLTCFAHSKGVRVVYGTSFPGANLTSGPNRHTWVQQQVDYIQTNNLDGINVDFEETIAKTNQAERDGLSLLMWELYGSLKKINPYYQITFDTPFYPETASGRVFDYLEMAQVVDFYMIMAYDMSEVSKPWANCPLNLTEWGVAQFNAAGIPASKLVLGVPWYGYDYPCSTIVSNVCTLAAKGSQVVYAVIAETLFPQAIGGRFFDNDAKSPYFNYKENKTGQLHQVWYDDPQSLMYKYQFAINKNLRGVGMWTADSLDYGNSTMAKKLRIPMWDELP